MLQYPTAPYRDIAFLTASITKTLLYVASALDSSIDSSSILPTVSLYSGNNIELLSEIDLKNIVTNRLADHQTALLATAESMNGLIVLRLDPANTEVVNLLLNFIQLSTHKYF